MKTIEKTPFGCALTGVALFIALVLLTWVFGGPATQGPPKPGEPPSPHQMPIRP